MAPAASRPVILALDSAGSGCSAAVGLDGTVLAVESIAGLHGHAERLMPIVDLVMLRAGLLPTALDCAAVTVGPGSFTGIRVGLAAARGIALAIRTRLIGVTSFEAAAAGAGERDTPLPGFLLVALESRRDEIFIQLFDGARQPIGAPAAVAPADLGKVVETAVGAAPLQIAGDASCRVAFLLSERAGTIRLDGDRPTAVGTLRAAWRRLQLEDPGDGARPLYLRSPQVTLPKGRRAATRHRQCR